MNTELEAKFRQRFGTDSTEFEAPGRVNLIGEHTDYNDGYVLPAVIGFQTRVAMAPVQDRRLIVFSEAFDGEDNLDLDRPSPARKTWSDYVFGVALHLERAGFELPGARLYIQGDVPMGAGLGSSASLEVAVGLALLASGGHEADRKQLALLCQQAENDYVGMRCGIMDQFSAANGEADRALLLDCRSLGYQMLPLFPDTRLVICNSMVHHQLAGSDYNTRRAECEEGMRFFANRYPGLRALRDVSFEQLQAVATDMPDVLFRRCRHVLSENRRVLAAANALRLLDAEAFGRLMYTSHRSLQSDYEVSCRELDLLVELAMGLPGVYGSRMTGGGFGGCTVSLVASSALNAFREAIIAEYQDQTGLSPDLYVS